MSGQSEEAAGGSIDGREKRGDARRSKTVRFSDPEWQSIENAADERGIPAAEYVRAAALDAAEGKTAALSAEIVETIRRIYRNTYIVATLKRDEMIREGRDDEMEKTIEAARESQELLAKQASK